MKNLLFVITFLFTSLALPAKNIGASNLEESNFAFAGCYVTVTTTEYNPITGTNVTTTTTYYLGEVDYGDYGLNYTACKLRAQTFVPALYNTP